MPKYLPTLLAVYICLALLYNWACPLFENADELYHFPLIHYLAENNLSLPVQNPAQRQQWAQQGGQPPLYHLLAAILISPIDRGDYADLYRPNPHARLGIVDESNINAIIHPLDRSRELRFSGTAFAARIVRLFSTFLGVVLIIAAYYLVIYTFPDLPRSVALFASALIAFNPMFLFVTTSANNDNLSNAVIAVMLAWLARLYRRDTLPPARDLLIIGVLLGMGLLSKLSMAPFMLLIGLYWLLLAIKFRAFPYMIQWGVVTLGIALLISGWWYWRNYDLYGDPTGLNTFLDIVGRRPLPLTAEQLWAERHSFIRSFWGVFGLFGVGMPNVVYSFLNILAALLLVGAALFYWQRRKMLDFPQIVPLLWACMSLISLMRWTSMTWASQGRLWFVAISALATIGAVGMYQIAHILDLTLNPSPQAERDFQYSLPLLAGEGVGIGVFLIALAAPILWIRPAYAAPDLYALTDETQPLAIYQAEPDQQIALTALTIPAANQAGEEWHIQADFCALTDLTADWSIFVHLLDEGGIITAQGDFTPGHGAIPTSELAPGQCWQEALPLWVDTSVITQATPTQVMIGFYDVQTGERMALSNGETSYAAGQITIQPGADQLVFADAIRIKDYTLSTREAAAGEAIPLTITWEVLQPLPQDYTSFIQVLDPSTAYKVAAVDLGLPTRTWQVGAAITVKYNLIAAPDVLPGTYQITAGFYPPDHPGKRLRLTLRGADTERDTLFLGYLRITP